MNKLLVLLFVLCQAEPFLAHRPEFRDWVTSYPTLSSFITLLVCLVLIGLALKCRKVMQATEEVKPLLVSRRLRQETFDKLKKAEH